MEAVKDEGQKYILEKEIESPDATVRVFRPILSDEEREQRMAILRKAAARLLIAGK